MSSEATEEVNSLALKQNNYDELKRKSPKPSKELGKSPAENSTIPSDKKLKKNGHRHQAGLSSNNHTEKRSKPKDGQNNNNNHLKELSFFPADDDSEGSSSPLNLKISNKWIAKNNETTKESKTKFVAINNIEGSEKLKNGSPTASNNDCEVIETVHLNHQDDASSTSSCSCEDHSSNAGASDHEDHQDLDYDEDSISDSLPGTSNTTQEPTYQSNSSSQANRKQTPPGRTILSDSDSMMSDLDDTNKSSINNNNDDDSGIRKEKNVSIVRNNNSNNSRIKSVINFNHVKDRESVKLKGEEKLSNTKAHKSYECLLKYFFKDACYFQIKSINHENVKLSKSMGVWSTPIQNEVRLNTAFREHRNVILIFSVQQSGGFQGFARMVSEAKPSSRTVPWVLPERMSKKSLGGILRVEWLCTKELPFHETHDLYNPFNDNKPIKIARDGQQVEPRIGKKLCKLFPRDSKEKLLSSLTTLKRQTSQRKKSSHRQDNFYPLTDRRGYIEERHRQSYILMQGTNGPGEPCVPSHISHDHSNIYNSHEKTYRPTGRRRMFDQQPSHGIYHRQNIYPNHFGSPRPTHMPRNVDVMPRCLIPGSHDEFHQGYGPPTAHHYPNPYDTWMPQNPDMNRYHPYQRSRR